MSIAVAKNPNRDFVMNDSRGVIGGVFALALGVY